MHQCELDLQLKTIQDIAYLKDPAGIPQLINFLETDGDPRLPWAASWALERRWDDRAAEPIAAALQRVDLHEPVLAHLKGSDALLPLLESLKFKGEEAPERWIAYRIAPSLVHAYDERVESALLDMLEHSDSYLGWGALIPLATHSSEAVLARVSDFALHHCFSPLLEMELGRVSRPEIAACALDHLKDCDPELREKALRLLAITKGQESLEALLGALDDPCAEIRLAAVDLVEEFTWGQPVADRLASVLCDPNDEIKNKAAHVLAMRGDPRGMSHLRQLVEGEDKYNYQYLLPLAHLAAAGYGREWLMGYLHGIVSEDPIEIGRYPVPLSVVDVLGDPSFVPYLLKILDDPRWISHDTDLLVVLDHLAPPLGLDRLLAIARDGDRRAQITATEALAKFPFLPLDAASSILPALEAHSLSWEYAPSSGPAIALGLTGNPEVYPHLRAMLDQPNLVGPAVEGLQKLLETGAGNLTVSDLQSLSGLRDTYLFRYEWYSADYSECQEIKAIHAAPIIRMAKEELQRR